MPRSKNPHSGALLFPLFYLLHPAVVFFMGVIRGDDLGYYLFADQLANGSLLPANWGGLNRTGLYVPTSLFIRIFGSSEFVALIFPLLASMLTLGFIYGIGRLLSGEKAALVSAIIWAVAPLDVFLASQLMPDGPSVMMQTGAIFFLLLGLRGSRRKVRLVSLCLDAFVFLLVFCRPRNRISFLCSLLLGLFFFSSLHGSSCGLQRRSVARAHV